MTTADPQRWGKPDECDARGNFNLTEPSPDGAIWRPDPDRFRAMNHRYQILSLLKMG